jgi:DNA-binding beta-propeller fold protein YncE
MSTWKPVAKQMASAVAVAAAGLLVLVGSLTGQSGPSPYRLVEGWPTMPAGREMGAVGKATIDPDGRHIWAVVRCDAPGEDFGWECLESDLDPILKFDPDGNVVESFGGGLFIWPHGIDVDRSGNVWVTDAVSTARIPQGDTRGHQVIKFSPTGEVLLRLGTPGREGGGRTGFTSPSDVAVAANGDVFVADGHNNVGNNRVVKFASDGSYLMEWGQTGYAPGEFRALHAIDIDADGRVFVGDRSNNRTQILQAAAQPEQRGGYRRDQQQVDHAQGGGRVTIKLDRQGVDVKDSGRLGIP